MSTKRIWKYEFGVDDPDPIELDMPINGKILSVGSQNPGRICIWVLVHPLSDLEKRILRVVGTGHSIKFDLDRHQFLGSVIDGEFVWHVFAENLE